VPVAVAYGKRDIGAAASHAAMEEVDVNNTRTARNLSAAAVAGIAAWSSYHHMIDVALRYGERAEVAYALPISVDGMLVVASVAMVDDQRALRRIRPIARIAFTTGVAASVAANITAAQPSIGARIVAAWPALALLLVVELLGHPGRQAGRPHRAPAQPVAAASADRLSSQVATTGTRQRGKNHQRRPAGGTGDAAPPSTAAAARSQPPATGDRSEKARHVYRTSLAAGEPLTGRELGRMYGRSPSWGRERIGEVKAHDGHSDKNGRPA
jgi:hypothetical protein